MDVSLDHFILFGIAALNAYTVFITTRTHNVAIETKSIAILTEKNTNSLTDRLVETTAKASRAEGVKAEKDRNDGTSA